MAGSTHVAEFIAFRFISGAGAFMMLASVPVRLAPSKTWNNHALTNFSDLDE
jgi:hypothetical protein